MNVTKKIAAGFLAGSLAMVAAPAIAQDADTPTTQEGETSETETPETSEHADRPSREERREIRVAALAEILGVDADELSTTMRAIFEELKGTFEEGTTREEKKEVFTEALSDETGIPVEDLQAANDEVKADFMAARLERLAEKLAEKVEAGELTQEEADEIYAAAEAGDWPHRGRRGHGGPSGDGPRGARGEQAPAADQAA